MILQITAVLQVKDMGMIFSSRPSNKGFNNECRKLFLQECCLTFTASSYTEAMSLSLTNAKNCGSVG